MNPMMRKFDNYSNIMGSNGFNSINPMNGDAQSAGTTVPNSGNGNGVSGALSLQLNRIENFINFLAASNVDLDEVIESVQELLTLYEGWNAYDEISIRNGVHRMLLGMK
ncbi:unnamed protein product [Ambrosiozyma monospora]|uniref:Unnamed protein product n=1 Tax=Ambrosiozyma monospora TaxID=43982 RepID=A0ACB5U7U5_AMBMO|nr:unnamed protein product [Ambrosiozyma monospora]